MAATNVKQAPPGSEAPASGSVAGEASAVDGEAQRYRPLPTGTHGLDPQLVKRDQRERLEQAMIELIAAKGYPSVRIVDLAKLAHVSQPTFYSLYADKEDLFLSAYEEIATRSAKVVMQAYDGDGPHEQRVIAAMRAWAELAAAEPDATSLLVLGAFGAGARALERRTLIIEELERAIHVSRDGAPCADPSDLTVKAIIGGVREVTAARLREGRADELPALVDELTAWAACYPRRLPAGLQAPLATRGRPGAGVTAEPSARARRAEGRLPSGRSDMPRQFIVKSQRERIVDATAAIVSEKGLAALTIPEIARRANVSHQTFYDIYRSKHDAFLGAQKVGMHQALQVTAQAYESHAEDWPRAVVAGARALIDFLVSEPAHAHLSLVDTFASCPEAIEIRSATIKGFAAYLEPGRQLAGCEAVPAVTAEAVAGGAWQIMHHYIENDCIDELRDAAPQMTYFALTPFVGSAQAAAYALRDSA